MERFRDLSLNLAMTVILSTVVSVDISFLSFDFDKMSSKVLRDVTVYKYGYTNNFQSCL